MRNLGSERRVTKWNTCCGGSAGSRALALLATAALQTAAYAQAKPTGLAAHESLLTTAFFGLLLAFIGLVAWEVMDGKKASRSSLDIAKLAAAAAKKQSAAGAPSGSLAHLDAPPTSRPFAPPPPPPPPKQPMSEPSMEQSSPFAPPPQREDSGNNPFAAPPTEMLGASGVPHSLESTVAFSPSGPDAGSSGGWADLLQRVRAGEPEAASFDGGLSAPPLTEDESFVLPTSDAEASAAPSPASSSEAWEALLKRTTTGDGPKAGPPKTVPGDKIQLASNFQLPGEASPPPPPAPASPFGMGGGSPFGGAPSAAEPAPSNNMFGSSFDDGGATFPANPPAFTLPGSAPAAPEPSLGSSLGMGFSFSSDPTSEPSSPFGGGFGGGPSGFGAAPTASSSGGFESPSFKLPGSPAPTDDFGGGGSGGFQLPGAGGFGGAPGAGGANPFDFGGGGGDNPSSSTLPLSDLFSSKPGTGSPPAFQLPGGGGPMDFGAGLDNDAGNPGLGRTISLDFAKGGGQKPPPPLPKTEG
jgi:hypothetical protein